MKRESKFSNNKTVSTLLDKIHPWTTSDNVADGIHLTPEILHKICRKTKPPQYVIRS